MRKYLMVLGVSVQSLVAHKMRSFLTMLGVVIGVGAVIALVAVGQGTQAQVVNQFQSLGSNLLTVTAVHELRLLARGFAAERPPADRSGRQRNQGAGDSGRHGGAGVQRQQHDRVVRGQDRLTQRHRRHGRVCAGAQLDSHPRALHHRGGQRQPGDGGGAGPTGGGRPVRQRDRSIPLAKRSASTARTTR